MPLDGTTFVQSDAGIRRSEGTRKRVSCDYETFSEAPLTGASSVGVWEYSVHPSTRALMVAYDMHDGFGVQHVDLTCNPFPADLKVALLDPEVEKWAFNAAFERLITMNTLKIATPLKGWRCTTALANMQSFTGDLFQIGTAMGLPQFRLKDKEGSRLIKLFCQPQRITQKNPHVRRTRETDPEDWQRFCDYNAQDVVAEDGIRDKLIRYEVADDEWDAYECDQEINDRGLPVNREFVENADILAEVRRAELKRELKTLTKLWNPNSTAKLLPWLQERGYEYEDLQKASVKKMLAKDTECRKAGEPVLTNDARKALRLRQNVSRTSVKKFSAIMRRLSADDNLRHSFQFVGAARTLRWAGRGPQPHNLTHTPKQLKPEDDTPLNWEKLEVAARVIQSGNMSDLSLLFDEPMIALAGSVRSAFQAPEGYELLVCDLKAIETAVTAWLSGCTRMLNVFAEGRDPYRDFGVELYQKAYAAITGAERQICKPAVLGCFASDTLVLTQRGWAEISEVTSADRMFDGENFVSHGGVVYQGDKYVIDLGGVRVTPGHEVLVRANKWESACRLSQNTDIAKKAIALASGKLSPPVAERMDCTMFADVPVATLRRSINKILNLARVEVACPAQDGRNVNTPMVCTFDFGTRVETWSIDSQTDIMRLSRGAAALEMLDTAMADGVSSVDFGTYTNLLRIVLRFRDTAIQLWTSTGRTMTETMRPVISISFPKPGITETKRTCDGSTTAENECARLNLPNDLHRDIATPEQLPVKYDRACPPSTLSPIKRSVREPTFDILNSGPQNRFMVLTSDGPLIVHNCTYQLGGGEFKRNKRTGLWGYAENMGVDITREEAHRHVKLFRQIYSEIPEFWAALENAAKAALNGRPTTVNGKIRFAMNGPYLTVQLPSGRPMYYYKPRIVTKEFEGKDRVTGEPTVFTRRVLSYMGKNQITHQWGRVFSSGGKQCENVVQATARDILKIGMIRAREFGFELVGSVHDELIALVRKGDNCYTLEALRKCMVEAIAWTTGLPLDASGYLATIYRKD